MNSVAASESWANVRQNNISATLLFNILCAAHQEILSTQVHCQQKPTRPQVSTSPRTLITINGHSPVIFFCTIRLAAAPSLLLPSTPLRSPGLRTPPLTSSSISRSELQSDELADERVDKVEDGDRAITSIVRTWAALLSVITGPGPLLLLRLLLSTSWSSSSGGTRSQTYLASGDRIGWSALKSKPHRLVASSTCFFSCVSTILQKEGIRGFRVGCATDRGMMRTYRLVSSRSTGPKSIFRAFFSFFGLATSSREMVFVLDFVMPPVSRRLLPPW